MCPSGNSVAVSASTMVAHWSYEIRPQDTCGTPSGESAETFTSLPLFNSSRLTRMTVGPTFMSVVDTNNVASAIP